MADSKITALTALTAADPANDMIPIVDVSDTPPASGNTKRISINNILACSPSATLASATITGDLTLSAGTANGVPYLNASKVVTTSDKLSFAQTGGVFSTTFNINSLLGAANYKAGIVVTEDDNAFTLYGGSNYKLIDAYGYGTPNQLRFYASNVEQYRIGASGVFNWYDGAGGTRMTLNSTGLGVGVTPSAWGTYKALEIGTIGTGLAGAGYEAHILANCYFNAGWKYARSERAARFAVGEGFNDFRFYIAPSGTAGNAITFTQAMTLDASGNLFLGAATATAQGRQEITYDGSTLQGLNVIDSSATATATAVSFIKSSGTRGNILVTATGTTYNTVSDYRLKEFVKPLVGGLARISALKPSIYNWKSDGSNGEGFLAHELAEVVPAAVTGEKDAVNEDGSIKAQSVDMSRVVPILVAAIQELAAEVNALKNA